MILESNTTKWIVWCLIVCIVDETEKKQGNNPEQDLEDADFHPFHRKYVIGETFYLQLS